MIEIILVVVLVLELLRWIFGSIADGITRSDKSEKHNADVLERARRLVGPSDYDDL